MSIILIWQEVPDNLRLFVFPDDHPDKEAILACHSKMINSEQLPADHPVFYINEKIDNESEYEEFELYNQNDPLKRTMITSPDITAIVVSGILT